MTDDEQVGKGKVVYSAFILFYIHPYLLQVLFFFTVIYFTNGSIYEKVENGVFGSKIYTKISILRWLNDFNYRFPTTT